MLDGCGVVIRICAAPVVWFSRSGLSHFLRQVKRIMKTSQRGEVIEPGPVCLHLLCQISWFWHHCARFTLLDNILFNLHKIMKAGNGEDKTIYLLTREEVICEHRLVQDRVWKKGNDKKTERSKVREAGRMVNWNMTVGGTSSRHGHSLVIKGNDNGRKRQQRDRQRS